MGVTVVLLTCSYMSNEFVRIGYYVNNEYNDPELKENPPIEPDFSKVVWDNCDEVFMRMMVVFRIIMIIMVIIIMMMFLY